MSKTKEFEYLVAFETMVDKIKAEYNSESLNEYVELNEEDKKWFIVGADNVAVMAYVLFETKVKHENKYNFFERYLKLSECSKTNYLKDVAIQSLHEQLKVQYEYLEELTKLKKSTENLKQDIDSNEASLQILKVGATLSPYLDSNTIH